MTFWLRDFERSFDKLNISNVNCLGGCIASTSRISPTDSFSSKIMSSKKVIITVNSTKYLINATGNGSNIEVALMYGKNKDKKERSHWGLILKQWGNWQLNGKSQKCLLLHHMGNGIEICVGCVECCRKRVKNAYGSNVPNPKLRTYSMGTSRAAVKRFLGSTSLGRNVKYKYNNLYRKGEQYYEWRTTNCMRLVWDLMFHLKLDYDIAVKFTIQTVGNERWNEVFMTLFEKYPDFVEDIRKMWLDMKSQDELKKIVKLVDGQYHVDKGLLYYTLLKNGECLIL